MDKEKIAVLLLSDGTYFKGKAYGAIGEAKGEICFTTGMTGYQEVFTDPSFYGQVVIMNSVHIGNYGVKNTDEESNSVKISGLIAKNLSETYSRPLADDSLENYLIKNNVVAIHNIDTRALVTHVRQAGAMNCIISSLTEDIDELKEKLAQVPNMNGLELSSYVTTKDTYYLGDEKSSKRIAVIDFGIKKHILDCLVSRGAYLKVFPAKTNFEEIKSFNPNAYFLSNGPGDPSVMHYAMELTKKILEDDKPVFGICLGHQLIALANGAKTYKMHHGHRGINHPVLNLETMQSEITTQNHGFSVDAESLKNIDNIKITHKNLNDETIEGIRLKDKKVFSVQYHPEATPGPFDSDYLFDDFIKLI